MIKTDQANKGNRLNVILGGIILEIVVIKLIAPAIDEIPAKCKLKIVISTAVLLWEIFLERGG